MRFRAGRRRRRRCGISPPGLFPVASALYSGDGGEPMEVGLQAWSPCTGVGRRSCAVLGGGGWSWSCLSRMRRRLRLLRLLGGWIELELGAPAFVVGSEFRSSAEGTRGAAPTDGCSASASARPRRRASTAVLFKAFARWGFLLRRVRWRRPVAALAGDGAGDFVNLPAAKSPRTWL